MRTVYRVESCFSGQGPYNCADSFGTSLLGYTMAVAHTDCPKHPGPGGDYTIDGEPLWRYLAANARFGFVRPEQLIEWFWYFVEDLDEFHFVVREYTTDDNHIAETKRQCVFNKDYATVVHQTPILEFFDTHTR